MYASTIYSNRRHKKYKEKTQKAIAKSDLKIAAGEKKQEEKPKRAYVRNLGTMMKSALTKRKPESDISSIAHHAESVIDESLSLCFNTSIAAKSEDQNDDWRSPNSPAEKSKQKYV